MVAVVWAGTGQVGAVLKTQRLQPIVETGVEPEAVVDGTVTGPQRRQNLVIAGQEGRISGITGRGQRAYPSRTSVTT